MGKHVMMNPESIRWTQVSVNNRFGNSLPVDWTIAKLKSGEIIPRDLPLIRVAKFKGKFRSVDNRRLYCFKQAGLKQIPVVVIKEDRKMKQLFEKNKSKNNGTSVYMVDVPLNPKNLDCKVVTYDPTGERESKFWTVRQAIEELEGPKETSPELGELGELDNTTVLCGETEGISSLNLSDASLQKEGSVDTDF